MTLVHEARPDFASSGVTGAAVAAPALTLPARLRAADPDVGLVELIGMVSSLSETDHADTIIELYDLWLRHHPLDPQRFGVYFNAGTLFNQMGRHADALAALEQAIQLAPKFLSSYVNAGIALEGLDRLPEAAAHWLHVANGPGPMDEPDVALKITALRHLGRANESAKDYALAEIVYRQCLEIGPQQRDIIDHWVFMRQVQCKWPSIEPCADLTRSGVVAALSPLPLAILTVDPLFQLANAARYFEQDAVGSLPSQANASWAPPSPPRVGKQRLRIGYVSPDLRGHAIGFLTAELFGLHDRARVEVFAYYSGIASADATQARIRQTVDHWTVITGWDAGRAAQRIADDGIDILVDLGGHTSGAPATVFALRPAPVIVNWLGYPGSMGTPHHQYIIADPTIVPPEHEAYYSERVVRLPCYQPTDRQRIVAPQPSRHEVGLPDGAMVYCCFNGPQKITPATFRCWMLILARVPHAVLWLLSNDAPTEERLRQQAVCHGIAPERLIFARRKGNAEHMARYPFADLFLDTSPYGAHTTASDALWMGVPVLTLAGLSFASRVCASLVTAAGLPELVCGNRDGYVERAVELGTHPGALSGLRQRLRANRDRCTLFDMTLLVTRLEGLYAGMWDDYVSGRLPEPDLTNLPVYHAIGAGLDHDAAGDLDQPSYERRYRAALAARHETAPLPPDRRLWPGPPRQIPPAAIPAAPPERHNLTGAASMAVDSQPNPSFNALVATDVSVKVVDIGANPIDGSPPYAAMLRSGHATVVGFEPNPQALAKLNDAKGPRETYLPWAVADGRRHTLRICQAPGMTSLLQPNPEVLNLFHGFPDWGRVLSTEEVQTVRLDDVPETQGVALIKIDIQGGELMALRNATSRLRDTLVIQSEVEFLPMYVGQPLFSELESFLRQQGFMFHRFFPQVSRVVRPLLVDNSIFAGMSQLLWADAIFVRDLTRLDRLLNSQLLGMAAILHDCYGSVDLVLHLLTEHDRRTGGMLGSAYLAGLQRGMVSETVRG